MEKKGLSDKALDIYNTTEPFEVFEVEEGFEVEGLGILKNVKEIEEYLFRLRKEEIMQEIEEIKEGLNDVTANFVNEYDITSISYIEDYMSEYADSMVSVYYSDIDEYYQSHIQESSDALREFGYCLENFSDLEEACRKGAQLAEYQEYYNELIENLEDVEELKELLEELEEIEEE